MLPRGLQRFFWDVRFDTIDPVQHQRYVIERLLDRGDVPAVRWLLGYYSPASMITVLKQTRVLSRKSATFWALYFHVNPTEVPCIQKSWLRRLPPVSKSQSQFSRVSLPVNQSTGGV
ncbi:MAG: hypothetical protein HYV02_06220 [Deltaproteobacteria bacterium]|nr:hypothetical protein [Deltaproteobacteria bacterium]